MSLGCVYKDGLCSRLSEKAKVKKLNERDLSLPMSIASNFLPGIDLNNLVFNRQGYIVNSTDIVLEVMDAGLRRMYMDVFWDPTYQKWHLCPFRPASNFSPSNETLPYTTLTAIGTYPTVSLTINTGAVATNTAVIDMDPGTNRTKRRSFGDMKYNYSGFDDASSNKPACDYELDLNMFVNSIKSYLDLSDTNIAASLLYLHLRAHEWDVPDNGTYSQPYNFGTKNLTDAFSPIFDRILTPDKSRPAKKAAKSRHKSAKKNAATSTFSHKPATTTLPGPYSNPDENSGSDDENEDEDLDWPTLRTLLYSDADRLVISYESDVTDSIPDLQQFSTLAFNVNPTISNASNMSVSQLAPLNFSDTFVSTAAKWEDAVKAGVSPVLNGSSFDVFSNDMISMLNQYGNWAWAPGQPILYTSEVREDMLKNDNAQLAACAVLSHDGLAVANCYAHFPVLCKSKKNDFDWKLTPDNHSYFSPSCPKGYKFAVPQSPLEARFIRETLIPTGKDWHAWVDLNSLFLPNCWVYGGTNAVCPYNVVENSRNGVGYIAAAAAVTFFAGVLIILFEWDRSRSPLIRNYRKRDRRRRAYEFEGIPS